MPEINIPFLFWANRHDRRPTNRSAALFKINPNYSVLESARIAARDGKCATQARYEGEGVFGVCRTRVGFKRGILGTFLTDKEGERVLSAVISQFSTLIGLLYFSGISGPTNFKRRRRELGYCRRVVVVF